MKRRILLLSPFYKKNYMKNARCDFVSWSGTQWYPIQLGYLGAFLESKGYEVKLVDAQAYGLSDYDVGEIIGKFKPAFAVVYAGDQSFEVDWSFAYNMNKKMCPTKVVGPLYALNADKYKVPGIQGCLETGVLAWIEGKVDDKKPIVGVHLSHDELNKTPFVSNFFMKQLDPKHYRTPSEPWPFVDIMTGFGCEWGRCTFCLWPKTYKKKYTVRSIDRVMAEVAEIERKGFYKSIMIEDDSFSDWRAREFSELKCERKLKIPWSCLVRADLSFETLHLMKRAGCLNLHVGYESGNDRTLSRTKKGLLVSQMELFTYRAKEAGLRIHGDFLIGIDETTPEILKTIDWACKLSPDTAQFQVYIPYFEKPLHDKEWLAKMARYAYRRFYSRPKAWPGIARQFLKPMILRESLKTMLGVER